MRLGLFPRNTHSSDQLRAIPKRSISRTLRRRNHFRRYFLNSIGSDQQTSPEDATSYNGQAGISKPDPGVDDQPYEILLNGA